MSSATTTVRRWRAMGCEVVVGGADEQACLAIEALLSRRERTCSRFRADSELVRLNATREGRVRVSVDLARAVRDALGAARATDGLVDPTLHAAVVAAGYDASFERLPADGPPPGSAAGGRWREIAVDGLDVERPPGLALDLNGVVKARAVDDALAGLPAGGFVSIGGDLATTAPLDVLLPGDAAVRLTHGAVATAGTDRRRWLRGGTLQHHLIDPRTARPSSARWTAVSVVAGTCLAADVAARAAFLLDGDGPAWLDGRDLPGRFRGPRGVVVNAAWRALGLPVGDGERGGR